jgi:hypothetical protein
MPKGSKLPDNRTEKTTFFNLKLSLFVPARPSLNDAHLQDKLIRLAVTRSYLATTSECQSSLRNLFRAQVHDVRDDRGREQPAIRVCFAHEASLCHNK